MKTRKFIAIWIALMLITLCGCSSATNIDTGSTNDDTYSNYSFWEQENQLRLVTDFSYEEVEGDKLDGISGIGDIEITENDQKHINELKNGIIEFFKEFYSLDLSQQLSKQKIKIYSSNLEESTTMGYVDDDYPNILNLNELIFTDYVGLFENTYVHESLHQLGIRNIDSDQMLIEGLTDAYTDLILTHMGKKSVSTPLYFESRTLAYQLISVDKELPHLFFETKGFSLANRIDEKLKDVERIHHKVKSPGKYLAKLSTVLYSNNIGIMESRTDPYFYAYDAQEIVRAYCQAFNPSHEQIDYIRHHYLIDGYEELEFVKDGDNYSVK